jgi:hypothetical protein
MDLAKKLGVVDDFVEIPDSGRVKELAKLYPYGFDIVVEAAD